MKKDVHLFQTRPETAVAAKKKFRRRLIPAVFLCALLVLSACGKSQTVEDSGADTPAEEVTEEFPTEDSSSESITFDFEDIDNSGFAATIPESVPAAPEAAEPAAEEPFSAKGMDLTIVIDPGHSSQVPEGTEPIGPGAQETKAKDTIGILGKASSIYEYDLTMNVSKKLYAELEARGYKVILTHSDTILPMSQSERAAVANENKADAFIRIFANSSEDTSVHGASAVCITEKNPYHPEMFSPSLRLSDAILTTLCEKTGAALDRIWMTDTMTGNNWSEVPTTLIRLGYMSNPDEDLNLNMDSYRLSMAAAIADGLDRWFAQMPPEEKAMHPAFNNGASGNESAVISATDEASADGNTAAPAKAAPYETSTPSSTDPGNDPESPVDAVPVTSLPSNDYVVPQPDGQTVPNVSAGTGVGTPGLVDPSLTGTNPADINNAAELGTPANTPGTVTPVNPGTNANQPNAANTPNVTIPPISPAPGSDGHVDESDYLYFNNDENQAAYWSEGDEDDLNFQTDPDEASYTGGDLVE